MIRIQGVEYSYDDIKSMSEYLVNNEGFYRAQTFPSGDVVYWVDRRFPGGSESFLSMGRVDTSKPFVGWICYTSQNAFGGSECLTFQTSLKEAVNEYKAYCEAVGTNDCTMTLYYTHKADDGRMVASALEFEGVGCPFDYFDRRIERGPRGGVKVVST